MKNRKPSLIVGQGSCGKTTFALRYLPRHVSTARDCELSLSTRWVCFNPLEP